MSDKTALKRQITMLGLITDKPQTTSQILKKLQKEEFTCGIRTVQRDLDALDGLFNIYSEENTDGTPGKLWVKDVLGFSESQKDNMAAAVALITAQKQLSISAPPEISEQLDASFERANRLLEKAGSDTANWVKKVKVINPSHWLKPPLLAEEVMTAVRLSALNNTALAIHYKEHPHDPPVEIIVTGLGLFYRGSVAYFIACNHKENDIRRYPISRITKAAELVTAIAQGVEGFDLDVYERNNKLEFKYGESFRLQTSIHYSVQREIEDAHLGDNQVVTIVGEDTKFKLLEVDVPYTLNLIQWLLARAAYLKVLGPPEFKAKFEEEVKRAYHNAINAEPDVPKARNFQA